MIPLTIDEIDDYYQEVERGVGHRPRDIINIPNRGREEHRQYSTATIGFRAEIFVERKCMLDQNISNLYGLIWVQCTPVLKENIIGL